MPDLIQSLQANDLGHLRIVADFWGIELESPEKEQALQELSDGMLDTVMVIELVESLSDDAKQALEKLVAEDGKVPWQDFQRRFGKMRDTGGGKRDREKIHLSPISPVETLYYRGIIARAFFETPSGLQEYAYIPNDLIPLIPLKPSRDMQEPGRLAAPAEKEVPQNSTDVILDDACTLLASLRMGWKVLPSGTQLTIPQNVLNDFLHIANLIKHGADSHDLPDMCLENVKSFLESTRSNALLELVRSWLESKYFNELRQIPGLVFEGVWMNDPVKPRQFLLDILEGIPTCVWWSLTSLVSRIQTSKPEFMRASGEFDSWLIRRAEDDQFLHGFKHWQDVEGQLIRYIISGPMFWLGLVDLARSQEEGPVTAFRKTERYELLLSKKYSTDLQTENSNLNVSSNGRITIPPGFPRAIRYQVARYSHWEPQGKLDYRYRLTARSLSNARQQGLKVSNLLVLLEKYKAAPIPPSFIKSLKRWELNGTEARLEEPVILRLNHPAVLNELQRSKAARFLGEKLGPLTVVIKPGARGKIVAVLAELGLLAEEIDKEDIISGSEKHHE